MDDPAGANPYAAPTALLARSDIGNERAPNAGRWLRLGAYLLDALITVAAMIPGGILMVIGGASSRRDASGATLLWLVSGAGAMGLGAIAILIVNLVLLATHGQTIGKRICAIRIVRADGSRCGLGRIFWLRIVVPALLGAIPYAGPVFVYLVDPLFIVGAQRRCVHDLIADTRVVVA